MPYAIWHSRITLLTYKKKEWFTMFKYSHSCTCWPISWRSEARACWRCGWRGFTEKLESSEIYAHGIQRTAVPWRHCRLLAATSALGLRTSSQPNCWKLSSVIIGFFKCIDKINKYFHFPKFQESYRTEESYPEPQLMNRELNPEICTVLS